MHDREFSVSHYAKIGYVPNWFDISIWKNAGLFNNRMEIEVKFSLMCFIDKLLLQYDMLWENPWLCKDYDIRQHFMYCPILQK